MFEDFAIPAWGVKVLLAVLPAAIGCGIAMAVHAYIKHWSGKKPSEVRKEKKEEATAQNIAGLVYNFLFWGSRLNRHRLACSHHKCLNVMKPVQLRNGTQSIVVMWESLDSRPKFVLGVVIEGDHVRVEESEDVPLPIRQAIGRNEVELLAITLGEFLQTYKP